MTNIHLDVTDRVATITIDRPDKRNAMTYAMLDDLGTAFDESVERSDVASIVLTGVPGSFCAGIDLADLDATPESQRSSTGLGSNAFLDSAKPIVAAIDGPAVGMGVEFASMCDVRVASSRARFGWVFVHRGLVPDTGAGTWVLPRIVGVQHAADLLFSGEVIDAETASEIGFVTEVAAADDVVDRAHEIAARYSTGSPFAARQIKQLLYDGLGRDWAAHRRANAAAMERCFSSDDHREGVAAFLERRTPNFTGT